MTLALATTAARHERASTWTVRQLAIMSILDGLPPKTGAWGCTSLARVLHLNKPIVTRACTSLVAEGMVVREIDHGDRRLVRIALTPAGKKAMAELRREMVR